ncbi:mediator of RNA polymerase II transcription subunit 8 isoform X1 [Anabrus simplex]|uniref:mediator of RNA polymerase II transcription subunit 8 isoform X1 n=1 Tax=Anabrus simplex TaxID=316456 RepID=UPI0035A2A650
MFHTILTCYIIHIHEHQESKCWFLFSAAILAFVRQRFGVAFCLGLLRDGYRRGRCWETLDVYRTLVLSKWRTCRQPISLDVHTWCLNYKPDSIAEKLPPKSLSPINERSLTALSKMLSHDKCPPLRSLTVLPLRLSPERDEELMRLTENRVSTFSHDLVPDYLRTKPEPEVEQKMFQMEHKAASQSYETAQKQIAAYTKVVNHVWDIVSKSREEWESESGARSGTNQTSSVADTHALVAAVGMGKGLKAMVAQPVQSGPQSMMVAPGGRPGGGPQQPGAPMNPNQPGPMGPMGKAPSTIKTNIKAATQIHPYAR